ncbi:MAG: alpha/beta hydrolase [Actinobacteria bacterium]|nr:alpha/beta hydrolase [Actinomycetota bacterium]
MSEPTIRTVDIGRIELCVAESGAGGRPLLLVHGFTGAKEDFVEHLPALADAGWHVVAPDLRGHGASEAPGEESDYDFDVLAGDLLALATALGWPRFALLGHSMGGMVVQVAAVADPDRLLALVLMDTCSGPVVFDRELALGAAALVRHHGMAALAPLVASLPDGNPLDTAASRHVRQTRLSPLGGDDPASSWAAFGDAKLLAASPVMFAAMVPVMLDAEERLASLRHLEVPTLVVVGEQDATFFEASHALATTIPGARLEVIAGAGHNPQHEAPEAWRQVVLGFLAETVAPAG